MFIEFMQKILVEIIGENGIKTKKKYPIAGNTVVIRKGVKNHPAWNPTFTKDSVIFFYRYRHTFNKLTPMLMIKQDAPEFIDFSSGKMASFDRKTGEQWFKMQVIKSAGATGQKLQIPIMLWLLVGLNIAIGLVSLMLSTGRIAIA